ncbi:WbqC family protein [Saliphagus sp. LR7]|uniref:WbqC family protein n=1 Tax=Saliphagus sp. LR7 TaxID=2282654 RepID=UPI000DF72CC4|nr:WbqC family protein [Saliphagus sp. LR7]
MTGLVAAYQPHYYPRLHYLARARQADVFVIYDDVQFSRSSPHHRAPIDYQGRSWLTVPVRNTGVETPIDDARIDMSEPWPARHLRTLVGKYGEAATELRPFYERLCPPLVDASDLRENPPADAGDDEVDAWRMVDAEWRTRRRRLDRLRARKNRLGDEIALRKREDPAAPVEGLVAAAADLESRLERVEGDCRELKARRDRSLAALSAELEGTVEGTPMERRWELEGVDVGEWAGEVRLVDLTVPLLSELFDRFGVGSRVVRSSELPVERTGDAPEYLARLTEHFGGDGYLSGRTGYENYMRTGPFERRGLEVLVQDWTPDWEGGNVCALDVLYGAEDPSRWIE